ncbi:pyridoxamine kinase [Treponema sp.]|uniref:pyridoxamine kinase n=1 Tax=Treponema sp. TaxID=166 RepID=UPI00298D77FB|nr:pyridoxamine kinase [Treponema sp.]MCR5613544.1 pyridoxamine kinase [Treponema sp.]
MDKRLLTIQDISCVGQCSLTVALPVISACGIETGILPSSVLSNHTAGFSGWTFHDLTDDMPKILDRWLTEKVTFDAFYTGYVSKAQIPHILDIMEKTARAGALRIVDPVMADNGKLYAGFDDDFPQEMKKLCKGADVIMPNLTEAAFLLGQPYVAEGYDKAFIEKMARDLAALGAKNVIVTGVSFESDKLGVAVYSTEKDTVEYYFNEKQAVSSHGTGDLYASVVAGSLLRGKTLLEAASLGADVVVEAIKLTAGDKDHWYGVKFEQALPYLIKRLEK